MFAVGTSSLALTFRAGGVVDGVLSLPGESPTSSLPLPSSSSAIMFSRILARLFRSAASSISSCFVTAMNRDLFGSSGLAVVVSFFAGSAVSKYISTLFEDRGDNGGVGWSAARE